MTMTLGHLAEAHNISLDGDHDLSFEIPVLTGPQAQGDLIILPARPTKGAGTPIPADGVPVLRGENGGNTHLLVGDGTWHAATGRNRSDLGTLAVPIGGTCWLLHPEHGANAIGPGTYGLRRQQEQADQIRQVAD